MIPTDLLFSAWPAALTLLLLSPACSTPGWAWDRVPDADVTHYEIQASVMVCNHTLCASVDEAGNPILVPCCNYDPRTPWQALREEPQVSDATVCASDADLHMPTCLDCVIFLRVCAVDAGGLLSPDCGGS
jgi:hypothetical protein